MVSTEASRAEAFASQADRSRDQAAGYLQQTISTLKSVIIAKAQIGQWLAAISVPFRWEGTRLVLQGPDGVWVVGPDLAGLGIVGAEIVGGHLRFTFSSGVVSDLGQVVPDGDFVGPSTSVDGEIMVFDGTTGKRGKGSGRSIGSFAQTIHAHPVSDLSDATALARLILQAVSASDIRALLELVKGAGAGNIPVLNSSGKLETSVLPEEILGAMSYKGTWNATTNSPAIPAASAANKGWYYVVATAGTTNIGGVTDWQIGDWVVSSGSGWNKIDSSDQVTAVAGLQGNIPAADLKAALAVSAADITDLSANGRSLVKAANYAAMKALLGLVVGVDVQPYDADLTAISGLAPAFGNVIAWNGTTWTAVAPSASPTLIVRDEKPNNTHGGAAAVGWNTRVLNTVSINTISGASLSSNRVTLPPGSYEVFAFCPVYGVNQAKCRLRNVTDNATLVDGGQAPAWAGSPGYELQSFLLGSFTLGASKQVEFQVYATTANGTYGLGSAAGTGPAAIEVYSQVKIVKVA